MLEPRNKNVTSILYNAVNNKELKMKSFIIFFTAALCFISTQANSALIWDWTIVNPIQTVGSSDSVTFEAVISNDLLSTVTIQNLDEYVDNSAIGGISFDRLSILSGSSQEIFDLYDFDIGPIGPMTLQSQFAGIQLLPGESFHFELMSLVPSEGIVTAGIYEEIFANLSINVDGSFSHLSSNPVQITVVPLPPSLLLFISALLLGGVFSKGRKEF